MSTERKSARPIVPTRPTSVTGALHRNTDSEKTGVISPVKDEKTGKSPLHPLAFLALLVFLASMNASLYLVGAPLFVFVMILGTSLAGALLVWSGHLSARGKK